MTPTTGSNNRGEEIAALVERLEKANGPDRELDLAIGNMAGNLDAVNFVGVRLPQYSIPEHVPRYTVSTDAALTLVPDDWAVDVTRFAGRGIGKARLWREHDRIICDRAATPAIAVCIVAMTAIIRKSEGRT